MIPSGTRVHLACSAVDFRKGAAGLMALVRDSGNDPLSGALYVFRSRRADRIKIVWWDGSGVCLFAKRLDQGAFQWPRVEQSVVLLHAAQLLALIDGMDWKRVRTVPTRQPTALG
jgi:transposase